MGYKEVGALRNYHGWKDWNVDDAVEGKYLESGTQETKYGEQFWHDIAVTKADFPLKHEGIALRLNGAGSIDNKMETIAVGSKIKVIYNGFNKLEKGNYAGTRFHDVKVLIATEDAKANAVEDDEMDLGGL